MEAQSVWIKMEGLHARARSHEKLNTQLGTFSIKRVEFAAMFVGSDRFA